MNRQFTLSAALTAIAMSVCLAPGEARAANATYPAALCIPSSAVSTGNGQLPNTSASTQDYVCPVPSDSSVPFKSATSFHVYGYANANQCELSTDTGYVEYCVTYAAGGGGACSSAMYFGTTTNHAFDESTISVGSPWSTSSGGDSAYVFAELCGASGGSDNVLFSYSYAF